MDETKYMDALNELYLSLENSEISEEEYDEAEAEILEQLKAVRGLQKGTRIYRLTAMMRGGELAWRQFVLICRAGRDANEQFVRRTKGYKPFGAA